MIQLRLLVSFLLLFGLHNAFAQTQSLVLQPGPECGKDAVVWYLRSGHTRFGTPQERNIGNITYLCVAEWTWQGVPGSRWVLIDFLSELDLPQNLEITAARLSLYSPNEPTSDDYHSSFQVRRKHPVGVVQRVLEPWDEQQVTWLNRPAASRLNQVVLPAPKSVQDDFVDIDVTNLVRDMVAQPDQSHGFLIQMQDKDRYRKLIFASSDYDDPALRPRLEIQYKGSRLGISVPLNCQPPMECSLNFSDVFDKTGPSPAEYYQPELPPASVCVPTNYYCRIYNAAGEEVFRTSRLEEGWDGLFNGRPQPSGTYTIFCTYQHAQGKEIFTDCGQFELRMPRP